MEVMKGYWWLWPLVFGLGVIILILLPKRLTAKQVATIGILMALSTVLTFFTRVPLPIWGERVWISIGATLPIFIIALRYGFSIGLLGGIAFSLIEFLREPYFYHPFQFLLDFILADASIALAGFFKKNPAYGFALGWFFKLLFHTISGIIFFAQYAPKGWNPYIYSIAYNLSWGIPDIFFVVLIFYTTRKRMESLFLFVER